MPQRFLPADVLGLRDGTYLVLTGNTPPLHFGRDGRFRSVWGRMGDGPGEFRIAIYGFEVGDTVEIVDPFTRRRTRLTRSGRYLSTEPYNQQPGLGLLRTPVGFVANLGIATQSSVGLPLHVLAVNGEVVASFGDDAEAWRVGQSSWRRRIGWADSSSIWVATERRYVVERWSLTTRSRLTHHATDRPWFGVWDRATPPTPHAPPVTALYGIRGFGTGVALVWFRAPDDAWAEGLGAPREEDGRTEYPIEDFDKVYDTRIEVIEPATGRVLAQATLDTYLLPQSLSDGGLVGYRETEQGIVLDIYDVRLTPVTARGGRR